MKLIEMNEKQFSDLLMKLNYLNPQEWIKGKSAKEVIDTAHSGDWVLWLYKKVAPDNLKEHMLAKGHCANTVRHLMEDERSKKAVDAAIAFGEGKITRDELDDAAVAAHDAAFSAIDSTYAAAFSAVGVSYPASFAAFNAAYPAGFASFVAANATISTGFNRAYAAYSAFNAANADYFHSGATTENQLLTANICRKYLLFDKIHITI